MVSEESDTPFQTRCGCPSRGTTWTVFAQCGSWSARHSPMERYRCYVLFGWTTYCGPTECSLRSAAGVSMCATARRARCKMGTTTFISAGTGPIERACTCAFAWGRAQTTSRARVRGRGLRGRSRSSASQARDRQRCSRWTWVQAHLRAWCIRCCALRTTAAGSTRHFCDLIWMGMRRPFTVLLIFGRCCYVVATYTNGMYALILIFNLLCGIGVLGVAYWMI